MPRNKRRKPKQHRSHQPQRVIVDPSKRPMGKPQIIGENTQARIAVNTRQLRRQAR